MKSHGTGTLRLAGAIQGLHLVESRMSELTARDRVLSDLPKSVLARLDAISSTASYPAGAVLFLEGQQPSGVFLLASGRVKLSGGSGNGKSLIFRIADAGEIVGLPGTLSNKPYEVTAEALEETQADFIRRKEFLTVLRENGEAAVKVAEMLSNIYQATCQEVRCLGLSSSAKEKLARFLLDWSAGQAGQNGHPRALPTLTHEEIGEMIGASRETVTRHLAEFRRENLIELRSRCIVVKNQLSLERFVKPWYPPFRGLGDDNHKHL